MSGQQQQVFTKLKYLLIFPDRYCFEIGTLLSVFAFMAFQLGEELKNAGLNSFWKNLVTLFIKNWQKVIKFSPEILAAENVVCDGQLSNSKLYSTEGSAAPAWGRVRNNICTN